MADTGKMRFLKRFPESKHEQIKQLMSYITMCGVSGRDLVSIGGYIDRQRANEQYYQAKARVQEYIDQKTICPISADKSDQIVNRFKFKTINGDYNFRGDWASWEVFSVKTKTRQRYQPTSRSWPGHLNWNRRSFYDMVLDIVEGNIQLNF
jgi:hypothetical protein